MVTGFGLVDGTNFSLSEAPYSKSYGRYAESERMVSGFSGCRRTIAKRLQGRYDDRSDEYVFQRSRV